MTGRLTKGRVGRALKTALGSAQQGAWQPPFLVLTAASGTHVGLGPRQHSACWPTVIQDQGPGSPAEPAALLQTAKWGLTPSPKGQLPLLPVNRDAGASCILKGALSTSQARPVGSPHFVRCGVQADPPFSVAVRPECPKVRWVGSPGTS